MSSSVGLSLCDTLVSWSGLAMPAGLPWRLTMEAGATVPAGAAVGKSARKGVLEGPSARYKGVGVGAP